MDCYYVPDAKNVLENNIDMIFPSRTSRSTGRIRHITYNMRVGS